MYNKNILASMTPYVSKVEILAFTLGSPVADALIKITSAMSTFLSGSPTPSDRNLVFQLAENLITLFWCLSSVRQ